MNNNYFAIEGVDGSGKSTQIDRVFKLLAKSRKVVRTREPGGTEWGQKLRELMLNGGTNNEISLALAMFSDRVETAQNVIKPALLDDNIVIADRCWLSTLAYQGISPLRYQTIENICRSLSPFLFEPAYIFLLDVPVDVAMSYSKKKDVFERSGTGFYNSVRTRYLEIAESMPHSVFVVNGMQPEEDITDFIYSKILSLATESTKLPIVGAKYVRKEKAE